MATAVLPPCDETVGKDCGGGERDQRGTLIATVAGSSLAFVVGSIVNVALPAMQTEFGTDAAGAQWIVNAYLLPLGALVLIGGALGDHYGRRKAFLAGLSLFTLACAACAFAPTLPLLFAARTLLGVAAALVAPTSLAIIAEAFSGAERAKAVGTWAAAGAIGGAVAPVAGGWIVDNWGWRWAFGAVVPVAGIALALAYRFVRESTAAGSDKAPLDWTGAGLAAAALFALIWALIALPDREGSTLPLLALGGGLALLALFLLVEHRKADRAMTPLALFTEPTFAGVSLLTFFLYASLGGLLVLLPYVLIEAFAYGATQAGAALLPFPLVMGLLSRWLGGTVAERVGTRTILTIGPLGVMAGFLLLSQLPANGVSYWRDIMPGLIVLALGMAASVAPLTSAVLGSAGEARSGVASGVNNAISRIAGLAATALLGPVLASGDAIVASFGIACFVGAGGAATAALCAFALIRDQKNGEGSTTKPAAS